MATVKLNPVREASTVKSPSQQIVEEANRIVYVTDARGRNLGVRRITTPLRRRIFKALSAESAEKRQYLGMVFVAASCCSIDGEEVRLPNSELQFDALIDRLDDDGAEAVADAIRENFQVEEEGAGEAGE